MTKRQNDIERYLRGDMSAAEMNALEREALHDPFLADAIEGGQILAPDQFLFDVNQLRSSVAKKSATHRPKIISLWNWSIGIAASLLLVAAVGVYLVNNLTDRRPTLAENSIPVLYDQSYDTLEIVMPRAKVNHRPIKPRIERVRAFDRIGRRVEREVEVSMTDPASIQIETAEVSESSRAVSGTALSLKPRTITGTVTSAEDGAVLPGVNVIVKGSSVGTITDEEGKYEITLNQPSQKLEFAFIGVKPVVVDTRNKSQINVALTPDYESLSEIVVTGAAVNKQDHTTYNLAEPEGGRDAYEKYLSEKLVYPEQALANEVEGKVTIRFTIDLNGQMTNFKVLNSLGYGCDDEAIRLIREGPAWAPSKKNDKPVTEEVTVGLKFHIPDKKDP